VVASAAAALLLALLPSFAAAATPQPYGTHDAGGFRNVLPPGEAGVESISQAISFLGGGPPPPHFTDQQPLYENLLYASPTLTDAQVPKYYKDATFGIKPGNVESTITPRPGVTIQRDSAYGVPRIYGDTRGDVMFGAGYAGAADRLFLMDVLRHTGRAQLSSFLGGSNAAADADQWAFSPYSEADLQKQIDDAPKLYGKLGTRSVEDLQQYVAGINAYIAEANVNPDLKPAEYTLLGKPMETWKETDVIAIASLIGGIFGRGGGREVDSAKTMQAFAKHFGGKAGRRAWLDFRAKNDPESPTTLSKRFPYETTSAFAKRGLAIPDPGSVVATPTDASARAARVSPGPSPASGIASIGEGLRHALAGSAASNWELVSARESKSGHPLGVLGPQVGYYNPQILMEEELHGPGLDARGATFPGVNLIVQLGHGRDYAWSATSATSDNVDTFAEVLCQDDFHYLYRGKCRAMEKLVQTNSWTPNAIDSTPAGSQTLTAYRTVHGIVYARGTVHGRKVAFARARSTYFHEADAVIGFSQLNDPGFLTGPARFKKAVSNIHFLFNWAYIDSKQIAYALSGDMPQRAKGTSPDFPVLGTGPYDWRGYKPATHTAVWLPFFRHPQAVDPPFLVSWNNKQAPGWGSADDQYTYTSVHRSQMISDKVRAGIRGARKMTIAQLVQAMEEPATQDLRGYRILPLVFRVIGKPPKDVAGALGQLRAWVKAGAHRRDLNQDGIDEHNAAVETMDAWWPLLVTAEFKPVMGQPLIDQLRTMTANSLGDHTRTNPHAPDFLDYGWWGYVSKDLRSILGQNPRGAYSREYCGKGSRKACRRALLASLREALKVTPQELYGRGACASDPQPSCYDRNRPRVTSAISTGSFPLQNRPTFQQVVTLKHGVP